MYVISLSKTYIDSILILFLRCKTDMGRARICVKSFSLLFIQRDSNNPRHSAPGGTGLCWLMNRVQPVLHYRYCGRLGIAFSAENYSSFHSAIENSLCVKADLCGLDIKETSVTPQNRFEVLASGWSFWSSTIKYFSKMAEMNFQQITRSKLR